MRGSAAPRFTTRYKSVTEEKSGGATYTPAGLADFVAARVLEAIPDSSEPVRVLDPAVGDGELLLHIARRLAGKRRVEIHGFDVHPEAIRRAGDRLRELDPDIDLTLCHADFLRHVSENFASPSLFSPKSLPLFDVVIANPPYVRTQIMGAEQAQALAEIFGLTGRVDLYHAFLVAISRVLRPGGTAGIIVSNRFMTTRAGASVRASIREEFSLKHVWDLGDTKLFDAAVLPAVLLMQTKQGNKETRNPSFTTIYEATAEAAQIADDALKALSLEGAVRVGGRTFCVRQGVLDLTGPVDDIWRLSNEAGDAWLQTVASHTAMTFADLGKVRVGVKTCADKVFIRSDWDNFPKGRRPELLRPLTTHHVSRRFKAEELALSILYPHEMRDGVRKAVSLAAYPCARAYLEEHRAILEGRKYVIEAGREWYEIWVPQDPAAWESPKLVFRDISERPTFWIDESGSIVNGDCYWLTTGGKGVDLLWLAAAVANSRFIEEFYDRKFNNKLYAGRRRFITQYVEKFPLPNPKTKLAKKIIATSKAIYKAAGTPKAEELETALDMMIWQAFGLLGEKVAR